MKKNARRKSIDTKQTLNSDSISGVQLPFVCGLALLESYAFQHHRPTFTHGGDKSLDHKYKPL